MSSLSFIYLADFIHTSDNDIHVVPIHIMMVTIRMALIDERNSLQHGMSTAVKIYHNRFIEEFADLFYVDKLNERVANSTSVGNSDSQHAIRSPVGDGFSLRDGNDKGCADEETLAIGLFVESSCFMYRLHREKYFLAPVLAICHHDSGQSG